MKFEIYLEDYSIEIDGDFGMAIEYRYSNLTNPTVLTGDHSKTFTVKGTQHNNGVFGQIWSFNRKVLDDAVANSNIRVYFNPAKRTQCVMLMNGELFDKGYVRLNRISSNKGVITYELTFFSELVDILRTLMSAKLRDLPFSNDLRHTLNAATIKEHYFSGDEFRYIMASNGLYDEFESSKWLTKAGNTVKVDDVLNEIQMDETAIRQYRSYYQRPALMIKRIIDLIAQEHGIDLDPAFFNAANPYYNDSVLALSQYKVTEQIAQEVGEAWFGELHDDEAGADNDGTQTIEIPPATSAIIWGQGIDLQFQSKSSGVMSPSWSSILDFSALGKNKGQIVLEFEYRFIAYSADNLVVGSKYRFAKNDTTPYFYPYPVISGGTGGQVNFTIQHIRKLSYTFFEFEAIDAHTLEARFIYKRSAYPLSYGSRGTLGIWMPLRYVSDSIISTNGKQVVRFYFRDNAGQEDFILGNTLYRKSNGNPINVASYALQIRPIPTAPPDTGINDLNNYYPYGDGFTGQAITIDESYTLRSGAIVDKDDMLDDEITQGDFLINYAKLFGLIFYTDGRGTPHLVTRNTFFQAPKIFDWTDKVDRSQLIEQKPVPFDARYLSMKYTEGETFYEQLYRKHNGLEYGQQRINTGYGFNDNTTELISDVPFQNTVMSKERTRMLVGSQYIVKEEEKVLPAMFQKDGADRNGSETKYNLLFYNGAIELKDANQRYYITDDDERMLDENNNGGKICWVDPSKINDPQGKAYESQTSYPQYSTVDATGRFSWHIGYPVENYAGFTPAQFPRSATIFANFWQRYIQEIYDVNNRIMTAYVQLSPEEVRKWSFADFVVIDGVLWHPNRIIDFNPLGTRPTKVEFLRLSGNDAIETAYRNGQTDMSESTNEETE